MEELRECFFSTTLSSPLLKLPQDEPQILSIPLSSRRSDLSKLLVDMLTQEHGQAPPVTVFEFAVRSTLLRGSLGELCSALALNSEQQIELVYSLPLPKPTPESTLPLPEWVSCVRAISEPGKGAVVGLFNGQVMEVSSGSKSPSQAVGLHSRAVTATEAFCEGDTLVVVTASKDESVCISQRSLQKEGPLVKTDQSFLADDEVLSLARHPLDPRQFLSGGADGRLLRWDREGRSVRTEGGKKRKVEGLHPQEIFRIEGRLLALHWASLSQLLVGGADHALRLLDLGEGPAEARVAAHCSYKTVRCIDARGASLVLSGHEDGVIYAWDLARAPGAPNVKLRDAVEKGGEEQWVSGVKMHPKSPLHVISGHYSGALKVWDLRRPQAPLHSLHPHQDKLLSLDLLSDGRVVSGGADGQVVWTSLE